MRSPQPNPGLDPDELCRRLSMASGDCILEAPHVWLHDRDTTVQPALDDVAGIGGFYHPPVAAKGWRVSFELDGEVLRPVDWRWAPDSFTRHANASGWDFDSSLVVLEGGGFLITVAVVNRSDSPRTASFEWLLTPRVGVLPTDGWGWVPPDVDSPTKAAVAEGALVISVNDGTNTGWEIAFAASGGSRADLARLTFAGTLDLEPGASAALHLAMAASNDGDAALRAAYAVQNAVGIGRRAPESIRIRLAEAFQEFPRLETPNRELGDFYDRGLLSFQTCVWNSDAFLLKPHMAESGMDGGAVCNYFWGIAYVAKMLAISKPSLLKAHIVQSLRADPFEHYAYTPIAGTSVGPWYSYNQYSIVWCIYQYVQWTGDVEFLRSLVGGKTVFEWAWANATFKDDLSAPARLTDYGDDHNLLELKRTDAYRHFVPSPNAERVWCYRAVDEMAAWLGEPDPGLTARGTDLADLIDSLLWREDLGWFGTLDSEGRAHCCWSIQVFDLLRFGVLSPDRIAALVRHLNESEFLSAYGVHSLSKKDPGYDEGDVDWGGPGVYAGDGPELVEDLYIAGRFEEGDDLLRRMLWWGQRLPYYPQAIRADAVDYRRDGRANVVTGLKTSEAVLFGLTGLAVDGSGVVTCRPRLPSWASACDFRGVRVRGHTFDVAVDARGYRIWEDGVEVGRGDPGEPWTAGPNR